MDVKWDSHLFDPLRGELWEGARQIQRRLSEWRRMFHSRPELSGCEVNTARTILDELSAMGIKAELVPGQNAVVAHVYGEKPGGIAGLRADMDALPIQEEPGRDYGSTVPGVMHACGHDAHMAIQLGAAKLLQQTRGLWRGEVRLLFEPAEETVGGAQPMAGAGCLEGVGAVFALHMAPGMRTGRLWTRYGAMSGCSNDIIIKVKGTSCHGAYPERGVDAIVIAAQLINSLQAAVSRGVSALDSVVLSIGMICGGTAPNIIADEVTLRGTLRALSEETRDHMLKKIQKLAEGLCEGQGGACEMSALPGYHAVICEPALVDRLNDLAREIGMEALTKPTPSLGVDSFGDFTAVAPGVYYDLGCAANDDAAPLHTARFDVDERCLPLGAYLQAALAAEAAGRG
ncbi:MAG: amidohydrolase [Oscillospiraceae bacterium]|nr:amidohydrolase [Oscillospiraceae bacterium]